jgi:tricarballylate dehydrogenase
MAETGYDLVVIGMGAAGLCAAVSYAETAAAGGRAARIAVLERAPREERGGATKYTTSWFRITEDRSLDPNFIPLMVEYAGDRADLDYCRVLERESRASLDFLDAHGVEVIYFKQPLPNRNTGGGLGMPVGGGQAIVDGLAGVLEKVDGVDLLYETAGVSLRLSDEGRVAGLVVRGPDGATRTLDTRAVVIASGGFEGSREMRAEHLGPRGADMPVIAPGPENNQGDGIRMATEAGGDTAGRFDRFHGEPVDPRATKPDAVIYPFPYAIVVNERAERFFDEGQTSFDSSFERFAYEIFAHQNQTAFFIGDQRTLAVRALTDVIFTDQPAVTADTIGGLATALGLDPDALERTVSAFNAAIGPGEYDPYVFDGKSTVGLTPNKSNWAAPVDQPPYIAYPLTCAICFTFGGVRTDAAARVVTPEGTPIPGLYAAGEVTGLYYDEYPVGTSVLRALTFGRLAGAHAAREAT